MWIIIAIVVDGLIFKNRIGIQMLDIKLLGEMIH